MPRKLSESKTVQSLILQRLDELHTDVKHVRETDIPSMREQIAELKVKSSIWGAVTGTIGGGIIALLTMLRR